MVDDGPRRALHTLALMSAIAGIALPSGESVDRSDRCPNCPRSKLVVSVSGARYCHRCSFYEKALPHMVKP